jgi:opacity protein-like surface antigen
VQDAEQAGSAGGSLVDIDEGIGVGLGLGYYLSDRLMVGADLEWLAPDYSAQLVDDNGAVSSFDHDLTQLNFRFKGTFNFLTGPFSPYAELGAGWTYVDSNVGDGPPIVGCWWHPYFGYICDGYYETFSETSFSYGGALGLRYQFVGSTILRLSYNNYDLDGSGDSPDPTLNAARLDLGEVAWAYLVLGVEHILGGIDHLLFVLALLLIVRGSLRIVATITAFTLAHSITLVAATLGWIHMPGPPVEAIIALSIVFVAAEVVHGLRGKPALTARSPWVVAFSFGLLHGLGFAGALAEVGLPQKAIPVALLMFNVGVEVGQLVFVAAALLLGVLFVKLVTVRPAWTTGLVAYGIGSVAAFWTVERVASFWA